MITGIGVHDRMDSVFTINWIECSRSNGIRVHDRPDYALAALAGSAIGALATLGTTWLTQQYQLRTQRWAQESARRERLYGEFVDLSAQLYLDALTHPFDPAKVVPLYALVGRLRLFASDAAVGSAGIVMDRIVAAYLAPNIDFEVSGAERREELDLLREFTEICRADLNR